MIDISNTKKHFFGSVFAAIAVAIILHLTDTASRWYLWAMGWFGITLLVEFYQLLSSKMRAGDYLRTKWLDTIIDIGAGNAGFMLIMFVSVIGKYAGNVLRP